MEADMARPPLTLAPLNIAIEFRQLTEQAIRDVSERLDRIARSGSPDDVEQVRGIVAEMLRRNAELHVLTAYTVATGKAPGLLARVAARLATLIRS